MKRLIVCAVLLALASCDDQAQHRNSSTTNEAVAECGMDANCQASAGSAPHARADEGSAIPLCAPSDRRTRIPVWTPSVLSGDRLSSDPPQKDGQIVFIHLSAPADEVTCDNGSLNSFSRPSNPDSPADGGLAVNLKGNTQLTNGTCYFRGFYMNEPVMGMHQGWIETYFGAVEKEKVVLSAKFCLERAIT